MTMPTSARIRRILVANRGEIALRVMRTARALGIATVAVHSDVDADAPLRAVRRPGGSPAGRRERARPTSTAHASSLRRDASGADAIHPGLRLPLREPAASPAPSQAAGLTWIGPTPESIEAMALKVEAKRIAAAAGVPLVPGAELPQGIADDDALAAVRRGRLPAADQGERGRRRQGHARRRPSAMTCVEALASARREAASAFGDDTVFVERYLAGARHVEVQVFGDTHGNWSSTCSSASARSSAATRR